MALINRITRLFRADMHAVLDKLEEPKVLLRQAVREMAEDIAADEQRQKDIQQEQAYLKERHEEITLNLQQMEDELTLCFESDKSELARSLVKRKLETERFDKFLGKKNEQLQKNNEELQLRLQEHRNKLQAMQQKLELLAEEENSCRNDDLGQPDISVTDDEVEIAFMREQQKRQAS